MMDYSQHGEQSVILGYFQRNPPVHKFLVDVGAFGIPMSNSFALLSLEWKGLLIEADPLRFKAMQSDFAGKSVEMLQVGVSDCEDIISFHLHSELGHNSFLSDWYPPDKTGLFMPVKVRPLADILTERKIPFDFDMLSVDTEGLDYRIVSKLLKDSQYRPRMIVTESTSYTDADGLFIPYGYRYLTKTGNPQYGNFIYVRNTDCQ
jgi:FkbM family methyltransferase